MLSGRLVNNLNDGLAWGLVPLFLAAHGAGAASIGLVAAIYPGVWSLTQIATGHSSDTVGRKPLIVAGMLLRPRRSPSATATWHPRLRPPCCSATAPHWSTRR